MMFRKARDRRIHAQSGSSSWFDSASIIREAARSFHDQIPPILVKQFKVLLRTIALGKKRKKNKSKDC